MNRSAVALAADSAVTLSGSDSSSSVTKIFQNENKLFELSRHHPVGVMIYNATTFFDVPWEVIIKDFRREIADTTCDHIYIWADRFRDYVAGHPIFKPTMDRQKGFVEQILSEQFNLVMAHWSKAIEGLLFERQTKSVKSKYPELMMKVIEYYISQLQKIEFYSDLDDVKAAGILQSYKAEFDSAKLKVFGSLPLDQNHHNMLAQLVDKP